MQGANAAQHSPGSIHDLEEKGMNIIFNVASIHTCSIEMLIRPLHGTTYFPAPVIFLQLIWLLFLSAVFLVGDGLVGMIPFTHHKGPVGMFGLGAFAQFFFIVGLLQGVRKWRLMLHMELEQCGESEGPALFFFRCLPNGESFWFCRIILEPTFVFVTAVVLNRLLIIQSALETYLQIGAILLAMKEYIAWYRGWLFLRRLLDTRFVGPLLAKAMDNTASQDELVQVHMAGLPKDLSPDLRTAVVTHVARAYNYPEVNEK